MTAEREDRKKSARPHWFEELRDRICAAFEAIEREHTGQLSERPAGRFERKAWKRPGRGRRRCRRRRHVGHEGPRVRKSRRQRFDRLRPILARIRQDIPGAEEDPRFWASGISLVAHMQNPHVPAVHMNTRHIVTTRGWFGGGADLTPMFCRMRRTRAISMPRCSAPATRMTPNTTRASRNGATNISSCRTATKPRGAGGIFYDRLDSGDWEHDFAFTRDVGLAFLEVYPQIVRRRMEQPWTAADRDHQLVRRGRYVEFNLLYDRGTQFGLKTGRQYRSHLMSMPPEARWP